MTEIRVSAERRSFFRVRSLAAYLDISERTIRDMLARGVIPSYRVEGSRRIDPADVDAYLAQCKDTDARREAA